MNGMKNDMVHIVWYNSLSSMCNKLSYYVSQSLTSFLQAKNEIESLIMKIKELCNINLKGKKFRNRWSHRSPSSLWSVKTKGDPSKVASHIQKRRQCSRCKRSFMVCKCWHYSRKVGHTIRKCWQSTIPHGINDDDMVCKILYALLVNVNI